MFSKINLLRGEQPEHIDDDREHDDRRHRTADVRTSSYNTSLLFPILPSYPAILCFDGEPKQLGLDICLTTSTNISHSIKSVEQEARRLIGIDEREALCDGLAVMAEEYEEGDV